MKVLIAEDNPIFQCLLKGLLTKWRYEVLAVRSGDEAWACLQAEDGPRLAVLDWMMPGMDGLEICRLVRAQRRSAYVYIVVLTGKTNPADMIEALDAGADDYVTKPFHQQELRARLRAASRILELEEELAHRAHYDLLTGLPNRALLEIRFQQALESAQRRDGRMALYYLDLDGFKLINDSLGHATGDLVLQEVAKRLSACVRAGDTLSRVGGDEFVLVAPRIDGGEAASEIATRLLRELRRPISLGGQQIYAHASIGVSMFPEDGADFETLQNSADAAMFEAKRRARDGVQFFNSGMNERNRGKLRLDTELHGALQRREFTLEYQPLFDLPGCRMVGAEALLRWNSRVLGAVPPDTFIPITEETGDIAAIGSWVLKEACRQAHAWSKANRILRVGVNVSAIQFTASGLADLLAEIIRKTGLDPAQLELELTESALVKDFIASNRIIRSLHNLGVKVAIDDFGTGYSSFSYLQSMPVDTLKIDKSFVHGIGKNPRSIPVIRSMIALAHDLGIRGIAEGVESAEQLAVLRELGCDEVQGFLLGRPQMGEGLLQSGGAETACAMQELLQLGDVLDREVAPVTNHRD